MTNIDENSTELTTTTTPTTPSAVTSETIISSVKIEIVKENSDSSSDKDSQKIKKCFKCHCEPKKLSTICKSIAQSKYLKKSFYKNNSAYLSFILVYVILQIVLVIIQTHVYRENNWAILLARACGILISFNFGFILFLVLRRCITWLRSTRFGQKCLPSDYFLEFHKYVGLFILFLSLLHTLAHCINLYWLSREYYVSKFFNTSSFNDSMQNVAYVELLFTTKSNIGWFCQAAMPTGWVILIIMIIMYFFSIPCFRKKGHFQLFYYSHWLHVPIYIITVLHATNYWKWFIAPAVFVLFERASRYARIKSSNYGVTFIKDVNLLPSKVTQLIIPRPQNFKFKAGDYVFVNIPEIAFHEWHPFTISSAPELKEELWLHIRSLGNWTNKLHEHFSQYTKFNHQRVIYKRERKFGQLFRKDSIGFPNIVTLHYNEFENETVITEAPTNVQTEEQENKISTDLKPISERRTTVLRKLRFNFSNEIRNVWCDIRIDGPYGSAVSRRIFHAEHAVLIAGGIGVTPFASILQSLWFKYSKSLKTCPSCTHQWYETFEEKKLKKVDFVWVNRDPKSFEWFLDLLANLEMQQINSYSDRFLDIQLYITSASTKSEINSLKTCSNLIKKCAEENLSSLYDKIQPGRPDFDILFEDISRDNKGRVEIFFCGANEFGKFVQKKCERFNFKFSREFF